MYFISLDTAVSTVTMSSLTQQQQQSSGPCINCSLDLALESQQQQRHGNKYKGGTRKETAQLNSWHLHPFPSSAPSNLLPQISKHLKDSLSVFSIVIPTEKLQFRKAEKRLQHCPTTCWERRRQDWFSTGLPTPPRGVAAGYELPAGEPGRLCSTTLTPRTGHAHGHAGWKAVATFPAKRIVQTT